MLTVALAIFIGELGDKTQLTAITLSTSASYPLFILFGTTLGMVVTGWFGIIVGKKLGDNVPELYIKLGASLLFLVFGLSKLTSNVPVEFFTPLNLTIFFSLLLFAYSTLVYKTIVTYNNNSETAYIKQSRKLYEYFHQVRNTIEDICLGIDHCENCSGDVCPIGNTKTMIKYVLEDNVKELKALKHLEKQLEKNFDKAHVINTLKYSLETIEYDFDESRFMHIHHIRNNLEMILFHEHFHVDSLEEYKKRIKNIDSEVYHELFE
jgi:hypothetical protein